MGQLVLTRDCRGRVECRRHIGIHLDVHLALVHDPLIPLVHLLLQPVGEDVLQDRGDDVGDPILADLVNLDCIRQVFEYEGVVVLQELSDLVQRQGIVMRNIAMPHLFL